MVRSALGAQRRRSPELRCRPRRRQGFCAGGQAGSVVGLVHQAHEGSTEPAQLCRQGIRACRGDPLAARALQLSRCLVDAALAALQLAIGLAVPLQCVRSGLLSSTARFVDLSEHRTRDALSLTLVEGKPADEGTGHRREADRIAVAALAILTTPVGRACVAVIALDVGCTGDTTGNRLVRAALDITNVDRAGVGIVAIGVLDTHLAAGDELVCAAAIQADVVGARVVVIRAWNTFGDDARVVTLVTGRAALVTGGAGVTAVKATASPATGVGAVAEQPIVTGDGVRYVGAYTEAVALIVRADVLITGARLALGPRTAIHGLVAQVGALRAVRAGVTPVQVAATIGARIGAVAEAAIVARCSVREMHTRASAIAGIVRAFFSVALARGAVREWRVRAAPRPAHVGRTLLLVRCAGALIEIGAGLGHLVAYVGALAFRSAHARVSIVRKAAERGNTVDRLDHAQVGSIAEDAIIARLERRGAAVRLHLTPSDRRDKNNDSHQQIR